MLRLLIWLVVLAVFAFGFYLILGNKPAAAGRQVMPVTITTGTAVKGDFGVYLDAIGTVTPLHTASIYSQVSGSVVAVNYKEGGMVTKGDSLVDIDDRQYQATLLQAQGILERDESVLAQAQMDLARYQEAWARNSLAKQTLDDQEKLVLQDEGTVKNDQGTVAYDQIQVDYCHITAPFTGVAGLRLVDPGNLVNAGQGGTSSTPLVVVAQLQPITVIFTLAQTQLGQVQTQLRKNAQLPVEIYDTSAQTKLATGELTALDNQINTTTGTLKLRSTFDNDDFSLFPNQFVNTRLLVQTLQGVTLVPTETIQQNGQASYVYVIQNGVVHEKDIQLLSPDNGAGVTPVTGVDPGDILADSSFDKLQDNGKVIVLSGTGGGGFGGHHGHHQGTD